MRLLARFAGKWMNSGRRSPKTEFSLICGDCLSEMRQLAAGSVDVVVTSPPYNIGFRYRTYGDTVPRDEYLRWTREWCSEVMRLLSPGGSFFLNVGSVPSNPMVPHEIAVMLRDLFVLQNTFHWIKSITVSTPSGQEISVGHFKPLNSRRYVTDSHEYVFHFTVMGRVPLDRRAIGVAYADKSNIRRWRHSGGFDRRCRGNNWFIPYETIRSRRPHGATFPAQLAEWCIKIHGQTERMTVLDPFMGAGSSAVAARNCRVKRFIGIEMDEEYLSEARQIL